MRDSHPYLAEVFELFQAFQRLAFKSIHLAPEVNPFKRRRLYSGAVAHLQYELVAAAAMKSLPFGNEITKVWIE